MSVTIYTPPISTTTSGGGGGSTSVTWSGDLSGSSDTSQTVTSLRGVSVPSTPVSASVLVATSPTSLVYQLIGNESIGSGSAIDGRKITPNFGGQDLIVTGYAAISSSAGGSVATAGTLRFPNNISIQARNAANSANVVAMSYDQFGRYFFAESSISVTVTGPGINLAANEMTLSRQFLSFDPGLVPTFRQQTRTGNTATQPLNVQAQSAFATATGTKRNGATLQLQGGVRTDVSGTKGGVSIQLNASTSENAVQVLEVQPQATSPSRVVSLWFDTGITTTQMPTGTGDKVIFISNCNVAPNISPVTGVPVSGGILYVEAGALKYKGTSGTTTTIALA